MKRSGKVLSFVLSTLAAMSLGAGWVDVPQSRAAQRSWPHEARAQADIVDPTSDANEDCLPPDKTSRASASLQSEDWQCPYDCPAAVVTPAPEAFVPRAPAVCPEWNLDLLFAPEPAVETAKAPLGPHMSQSALDARWLLDQGHSTGLMLITDINALNDGLATAAEPVLVSPISPLVQAAGWSYQQRGQWDSWLLSIRGGLPTLAMPSAAPARNHWFGCAQVPVAQPARIADHYAAIIEWAMPAPGLRQPIAKVATEVNDASAADYSVRAECAAIARQSWSSAWQVVSRNINDWQSALSGWRQAVDVARQPADQPSAPSAENATEALQRATQGAWRPLIYPGL